MTRHSSTGLLMGLIFMGMGLVILGTALLVYFLVVPLNSQNDFSAVPADVNYPAPNLRLTDLNNSPVSLKDYRGQVVLVNLWATWCPPCKAEMPSLQTFYKKHKDQGFVIVGIDDGESPELVAKFVNDYGLTFPIWLDEKYLTESSFGTSVLPSSWIIDRQGRVVLAWVGAISRQTLEKYVIPIIEG